ncbi:CBS domain-containing protein [Celeribacter halophilus]|jgi:CBS domain-containing protein|uniref:CBS domain-containing protein n=1 Tax=Celeribacter halophilus TaxID=576117 RepID=A0A1I3NV48_9RHOB|nr:CBS domain-containing protein [Celeribacter halophilus]MBU2888487.1 CBS domain-containing protein [Celeribacter halophilus]MDO6509159.1 CBS domain-containing protein [Celeribacter halophilus]PZX14654.1 CBS domain protein [Celeribacter halophilus]SFJ13079.1 CBS domain-containing protein [Celeribacter halophilus]
MLVGQILKTKAIGEAITVRPDSTVAEAAKLLSSRKIGALIVATDPKHPEGILSERDIVRELGKTGSEILTHKVSDFMTRKLVSCRPDETALAVLEKMSTGRFRHMPVMDDGDMLGVVSIGDVVKARLEELAMENNALEGMIMGH